MRALRLAIRLTPTANVIVKTAGNPSGIAETAVAKANRKDSNKQKKVIMLTINWFKVIKAAIVAILVVALIVFGYGYFRERSKHENTKIELAVKTQEVTKLLDENGKIYSRVAEYKKTISELKDYGDSIEQKMYAEAKANKLKDYQISKLQYALIEARDSIKTNLVDSIILVKGIRYDKYGEFRNDYLDAQVYIEADSMTAELQYKYTIELYMTDSWTKRKFFLWRWFGMKGKTQQFDFKCTDPNANVKVLRSINTND